MTIIVPLELKYLRRINLLCPLKAVIIDSNLWITFRTVFRNHTLVIQVQQYNIHTYTKVTHNFCQAKQKILENINRLQNF